MTAAPDTPSHLGSVLGDPETIKGTHSAVTIQSYDYGWTMTAASHRSSRQTFTAVIYRCPMERHGPGWSCIGHRDQVTKLAKAINATYREG